MTWGWDLDHQSGSIFREGGDGILRVGFVYIVDDGFTDWYPIGFTIFAPPFFWENIFQTSWPSQAEDDQAPKKPILLKEKTWWLILCFKVTLRIIWPSNGRGWTCIVGVGSSKQPVLRGQDPYNTLNTPHMVGGPVIFQTHLKNSHVGRKKHAGFYRGSWAVGLPTVHRANRTL